MPLKKKDMASKNTFKIGTSTKTRFSIFSLLDSVINLDILVRYGLPLRFIPYILFITMIGIFYIGNNHYSERMIRKASRLEVEVDELRSDYTSMKAEYMFSSKQSEVAKEVEKFGLIESSEPPKKIIVGESEY